MIFIEKFSVCLAPHKSFTDKKILHIESKSTNLHVWGTFKVQIFDWKFEKFLICHRLLIVQVSSEKILSIFDGELISIFWPHFDTA